MKKVKKNLKVCFVVLFMTFSFIFSCTQSEFDVESNIEPDRVQKSSSTKTIELFNFYGQVHNDYLTHLHRNFVPPNTLPTEFSQRIDFVRSFTRTYTNNQVILSTEDKERMNQSLDIHKNLIVEDSLNKYMYQIDIHNNTPHILNLISQLSTDERIDNWEKNLFTEFITMDINMLKGNYVEGDFERFIAKKTKEYNERAYSINSKYGDVSGCLLAIANSSISWWGSNPDAPANQTKAAFLAPFAMADVRGSVWGAVVGFTFAKDLKSLATTVTAAAIGASLGPIRATWLGLGFLLSA